MVVRLARTSSNVVFPAPLTPTVVTYKRKKRLNIFQDSLSAVSVPGLTQPSTFCNIFLVSPLICTS